MSDEEKERLLHTGEKPKQSEESPVSINPRFYLIGLVLSLYYSSQTFLNYIISEWNQHYIKANVFGNTSDNIAQRGCEDTNHSDPSYKLYADVQEQSARWQTYNVLGSCVPIVLVITILPSYSDHVGRKFLLVLPMVSQFIKCTAITAVIYFKLHLIWIVVALIVDGFSGGYFSIVSGASGFCADLTKRGGGKRTILLTLLESVMLMNTTVAGFATGYLVKYTGFFIPVAGCAIANFLGAIIVICWLPESLEVKNRSTKTTIFGYFRRTFLFYGSAAFRGKRTAYILLIIAYFMELMGTANRANIETIYQLGMPFCWNSEQIGIFSALRHAAQGFVGPLFLVPLKWCLSDVNIGIFSAISNGGSFVLEGLAKNNLMLFLVPVPAIFSYLTVPMIKSIMSLMTPRDKQGSLFAGIMCVETICMITTNFVTNMVYEATVSFMHGFTFLVLAGTCCCVVGLLMTFRVTQKPEPSYTIAEKHINQSKV